MTRIERLENVNNHLSLALANLNTIAGGSYVLSLRDLKELVRLKIKLEQIIKHTVRGEQALKDKNYGN
jgi:hypothetical protein